MKQTITKRTARSILVTILSVVISFLMAVPGTSSSLQEQGTALENHHWESRTGERLAVSEQQDTLRQPRWTLLLEIVYHPNGRTLITSDMESMKVWDAYDLKLMSVENTDLFYITYGLISPDWKTVSAP